MWGTNPSEWLHWLGALDWSQLNNVVSSIVGVLGLTGIAWATIRFGLNPLAAWLGRRRAQSKLLDQLACGSSVAFVESLFGAAQFITYENEREQRTYHLRGAWVMIEIADARVIAFSITITNRRIYYNTKRLTRGFIDMNLGRDTFSEQEKFCDGEQYWMAAYRWGYARTYYLGRPGAYLRFIVSHNMSGTGDLSSSTSLPSGEIKSGAFSENYEPFRLTVPATDVTANTLTVIHPEAPSREFLARNIHGPDESHVKMATAIRPPDNRTIRTRLAYRRYQLKQGTKKMLGRQTS
ncbi:ETEC_3214 domain-containing protein [Mycolicibacterium pallens]|uniref:Uncharacterized protein n=1 Tax=Mycolicibacterium pallens TaxID=370524 RepID=A0ABX8VDI2_9MYCO|nr:ETEC_3214 domain-containing protein [Mycolicibacterium pallens]QYL15742.1 hypothetical protein K0O64_22085 [Mycolicibacterium pallens]